MYINKGNFFKNTQQYILNSVQIPWGDEIQDGASPLETAILDLELKALFLYMSLLHSCGIPFQSKPSVVISYQLLPTCL